MGFRLHIRWSFIWVALGMGTQLLGNSSHLVRSTTGEGNPFEVIYESDASESDKAPGIYVPKKDESLTPAILGKVLGAGKRESGILGQFAMSKLTNRHEAIAVVDGQIVVFSNLSTPGRAESVIRLGAKGAPILDVLTREAIRIDPIQQVEDINVVFGTPTHDGEFEGNIALLSVNQKHSRGSGYTFAFVLEHPGSKKGATLKTVGNIVLVDNEFYSLNDLNKIFVPRRFGVYSRSLMKFHVNPGVGDHPILKSWRSLVADVAAYYAPGSKVTSRAKLEAIRTQIDEVPWFWIPTGTPIVSKLTTGQLLEKPIDVTQRVNPLTGVTELQNGSVWMQLRLDVDEKGKLIAYPFSSDSDQSARAVIVSVSGRAHLLLESAHRSGSGFVVTDLGFGIGANDPITYSVAQTGKYFYVMMSRKNGADKITEAHVIQTESGVGRVIKKIQLFKDKALSQAELTARTKVTDDLSGKPVVIFDNVTPVAGKYDSRTVRTTPYLDLTNSEGELKQLYLKALHDVQISQTISYEEYDPKGAITDHTGLYLRQLGKDSVSVFVPGVLLSQGKKKASLSTTAISIGSGNPPVLVSLFALGDHDKKEKGTFRCVISFQTIEQEFRPTVLTVDLPFRFDLLRGVKLVPGRRKKEDRVSLLFFVDPMESGAKTVAEKNGGVYSVQFQMAYNYDTSPFCVEAAATQPGNWIEKTMVPLNTLKNRLVPDAEGNWYWVADPEIDIETAKFAVRDLNNPARLLYPNHPRSRKVLRHEETLVDDWGKLLQSSNWLVYSVADLKARFPELEKEIKRVADEEEEQSSAQQKDFPLLEEYFDRLARVGTEPGNHVILLQPKMMERFLGESMARLATNDEGLWSLTSRAAKDFFLFLMDNTDSSGEFAAEMKKIQAESMPRKRTVVFGSVHHLDPELEDAEIEEDADEDSEFDAGDLEEDPEEEADLSELEEMEQEGDEEEVTPKVKGSKLLLLATAGQEASRTLLAKENAPRAKYSSVLLATPTQWRMAEEKLLREGGKAAVDRYTVETRFLTSSWTVWPPISKRANAQVKSLYRAPVSADEHQVFANLGPMLEESANRKATPKHRVFIVPDELKGLVERLILSRWATKAKTFSDGKWNFSNDELALYQLGRGEEEGGQNQSDVISNIMSMRAATDQRAAVLYGRLEEVLRIGRPMPSDNKRGYVLRDAAIKKTRGFDEALSKARSSKKKTEREVPKPPKGLVPPGGVVQHELEEEFDEEENEDRERYPHLLWLLANEGRMPKAEKFSTQESELEVSTVLLGSEKEWLALQSEVEFERRFGLGEHFEVVKLEAPSRQVKEELIHNLLKRPQVTRLGYRYQLGEISGDEAKRQLVSLIVARAGQIARKFRLDETTGFIKTFAELARCLAEDVELRRSKVVDRYFVESLFARVFPVPLSFEVLPPNDYLHKLRDPTQAAIALQALGYNSTMDLKTSVVRTITSQTRASGAGRPIPSSTILFGPTSKGKTYLFETLMKFLGLQAYDYDDPDNENAQYIIVKVGTLVETEDASQPGSRTVDKELEHINNLLSLPNGHRSFILFDDLHKATSVKVLRKIMAFQQSLFEAEDGYITVKRLSTGERRPIPVRNLNLYASVNPARNKDLLDRYLGEDRDDLTGQVIAALARDGFELEDSFLARWSLILNVDAFSSDAKIPALVRVMRGTQEMEFNAVPRIVMVTPQLLGDLVGASKDANAREFLTTAAHSLLDLDHSLPNSPLYIASSNIPRTSIHSDPSQMHAGMSEEDRIEGFVDRHRVTRAVTPEDLDSRLDLISLVMDGFRYLVYQFFLRASQLEPAISQNVAMRNHVLAPLFLAVAHGLEAAPNLPLSELKIGSGELPDLSLERRDYLFQLIEARRELEGASIFPFPFVAELGGEQVRLGDFLKDVATPDRTRNRSVVLSEYSGKIVKLLQPLMAKYFRIGSLANLPPVGQWFATLSTEEPKAEFEHLATELSRLFLEFGVALNALDLEESIRGDMEQLSTYDQARFFLLAIDRAVLELPWARMSDYLYALLSASAKDLSLGQNEGFQNYLFKHHLSPFALTSSDGALQMLDTLKEVKSLSGERGDRMHRKYRERCLEFLVGEKGSQ